MKIIATVGLAVMFSIVAAPALAYIGPGAGITVIGAAFGVLATIAVVIFSLLWYPVRRLRGKKKRKITDAESETLASEREPRPD